MAAAAAAADDDDDVVVDGDSVVVDDVDVVGSCRLCMVLQRRKNIISHYSF